MQPAQDAKPDRTIRVGSDVLGKDSPQGGTRASPQWLRPCPPVYEGGTVVGGEHQVLNSTTAVVVDLRCDDQISASLTADFTRIIVSLEEVGGIFVVSDGAPFRTGDRYAHNAFSVIPAGTDAWGYASKLRYMRQLSLQLDSATLLEQFGDCVDVKGALAARLMVCDARLLSIGRALAADIMSSAPAGRLFTESLLLALLSTLASLGRCDHEQFTRRGGLSPWRKRRATEYLLANMSADVELGVLAELVGLSKSHFCREFKTATGLSPYRWLLQARLGRAKDLLSRGELSIAEIALAAGFADQAHLTRTFSKWEGISPGAWARSRLCGDGLVQDVEAGRPIRTDKASGPRAMSPATPCAGPAKPMV